MKISKIFLIGIFRLRNGQKSSPSLLLVGGHGTSQFHDQDEDDDDDEDDVQLRRKWELEDILLKVGF